MTEDYYREEAFSMLGALSEATSRIKLALGVTNPYTRNPALLAMSAATTDMLSGGRFILGLGRSERHSIESEMGIPYEAPLKRLEETVKVLKRLFKGETVYNPYLGLGAVSLRLRPRNGQLGVYLAASGPKTLRLAGKVADGVILNAYSPIGYVKYAIEEVKMGAEEAGRKGAEIDIACVLIVRKVEDVSTVMAAMRKRVASMLCEPLIGELLLEKGGFDSSYLREIRALMSRGEEDKAARWVTEELAKAMYVAGSRDECLQRIREYRGAGVSLPILLPQLSQFADVAQSLSNA